MMSRRAKPSEADRVNRVLKVDLLTPGDGNEHVVALDGLPILVNKANPIEQLSLNQIARIFSGEIRNWKDVRGRDARGAPVSGRNAPIHIHARNNKSGAYDVFRSIVLEQPNGRARTLSSEAARYESNEQLSEAVSRDPSAIGFAPFPYIKQNRPLRVILSCGISVAPTRFSVKSEEYPLARRMYIYTPGAPSQPLADELLQYAMSDEAQKIVNDAGFIDQEMEFQSPTEQLHWIKTVTAATGNGLPANKRAPEGAVRAFFAAIRGMRRSSMVFRFENGESDLDAKALQDSVRLAAYLRSPAGRHKKFLLVGFADAIGDWGANAKLSSQRADRVAARLRSLGVHISSQSVTSFSYLAPVACNNAAGRFQNRRVEVWIGK
jgi:phosphate transport system substrate-binding protein